MGCICSDAAATNLSAELDENAMQANSDINGHMKIEEEIDESTRKLLLLGAGSSGKSTLLKQMKYLYTYQHDYPQDELSKYKAIVYENLIAILATLCKQCVETFKYENEEKNQIYIQQLLNSDIKSSLLGFESNYELKQCLKAVWNDQGIKQTFERRHEYVLMDNALYLLDELPRIIDENYIPSFKDVIFTRSVTTGITKENFVYQGKRDSKERYEIVDVGGQRTERRKWIQCFDNVLGIIFCMALSGYDQVLWEDNTINKFEEALSLLYKLLHSEKYKPLRNAKFIMIFLNKRDLFQQKLEKVPFKYKDEYGPTQDYDAIITWVKRKIQAMDEERTFFFNVTCATDTDDVDRVFHQCHNMVIRSAMGRSGFL